MTKLLTTIPFVGFYETYHSEVFQQWLERELEYLQHECKLKDEQVIDASDIFNNGIDWQALFLDYAKLYASQFSHNYGLALEFDSLESPKYYNYTTDRIFCTLSVTEAKRIWKGTEREELEKVLAAHFTSYDGFISFYSPDIKALPEHIDAFDCNQLGCLIEAYIKQEAQVSDLYEDEIYISQELECNGHLSNILFEHMNAETRAYFDNLRELGEQNVKH